MEIRAETATVQEVEPLRELRRQELACQIVHDSLPGRGLADAYAIRVDEELAGYGCVGNSEQVYPGRVLEFYLRPGFRVRSTRLFERFVAESGAAGIRAQTNDPLLSSALFDTATDIEADYVLFRDGDATQWEAPGANLRRTTPDDRSRMFPHTVVPVGDWLLDVDGEIVATGGTLHHYNPPFADLYMETAELHRGRGYASFLLQEVMRVTRENGQVPAARCRVDNHASRRTLQKAGMVPCGHILNGVLRRAEFVPERTFELPAP